MPQKNYRMAKRNREESRKKRQQEKLVRKQQRGPEPPADAAVTPTVDTDTQGTT